MNMLKVARILLLVPLFLAIAHVPGADAKKTAHKGKGKGKHAVAAKYSPPAREIFGHIAQPSPKPARVIGGYAKGCLAGADPLPIDGPAWQAMRLSRNRNWGYPALVSFVQKLATETKQHDSWNGLLVGDMSQPMGGPMLTGHASHQSGLDVDIWLKQMPARTLTRDERETEAPVSMLAADGQTVDPQVWTESHLKVIKRAASYPQVARIFVHPAIKKALCDGAGTDRGWLTKVHPYWGHHYHFHVRLTCPAGMASCQNQPGHPVGDGCGKEIGGWLKKVKGTIKPEPVQPTQPAKPYAPKRSTTMAELPSECSKLAGFDPNAKQIAVPAGQVPIPERKPNDLGKPTPAVMPASAKGKK
jgi:penicillin-insensitive murein DD-endopeptidase